MVAIPLNDLRRGYLSQRDEIDAAVARVLTSGWYIHGPEHEAFEAEFAEYTGVSHCVAVASGTDALELALRATGRAGGSVITAANAGGYTSAAARSAGFAVTYADVDAATLCLTAQTVEPVLQADTAAVVVTHLYGRLANIEDVVALCQARGVPLVEDCAQAVGATRHGRRAGSFGDAAAFSFYPTKNLGALGDGGAVVTADGAHAATLRRLRQYGWRTKYVTDVRGGRNSRLDEIQAAVLRVRLRVVDELNARRRAVIGHYEEAARGSGLRVLSVDGEDHVGHLAVAMTEQRDAVRSRFAEAGVGTDVHYPVPDHRQPVVADAFRNLALPVTEAAASRVMSLPCFPELSEAEVDQVCDVLAGT